MSDYIVTGVRREQSADNSHKHIQGVCAGGVYYTRRQVVDSINAGNKWITSSGELTATITVIGYCPASDCMASPYIKTNPDSTKLDNLEKLPDC